MAAYTITVQVNIEAADEASARAALVRELDGETPNTNYRILEVVEMDGDTRSEWGNKCIAVLHSAFPDNKEDVKAYCDESEHQDGYEYWEQFPMVEDVLVDFRLYMGAVYGD